MLTEYCCDCEPVATVEDTGQPCSPIVRLLVPHRYMTARTVVQRMDTGAETTWGELLDLGPVVPYTERSAFDAVGETDR